VQLLCQNKAGKKRGPTTGGTVASFLFKKSGAEKEKKGGVGSSMLGKMLEAEGKKKKPVCFCGEGRPGKKNRGCDGRWEERQ